MYVDTLEMCLRHPPRVSPLTRYRACASVLEPDKLDAAILVEPPLSEKKIHKSFIAEDALRRRNSWANLCV